MDGLAEIAVGGAPVITTGLGMGAVFLCLTLLYVVTRAIGRWPSHRPALSREASSVESVAHGAEANALPVARQAPAALEDGLVAAMVLALARHRSSRREMAVEEPRGAAAWKIAARMEALRGR